MEWWFKKYQEMQKKNKAGFHNMRSMGHGPNIGVYILFLSKKSCIKISQGKRVEFYKGDHPKGETPVGTAQWPCQKISEKAAQQMLAGV